MIRPADASDLDQVRALFREYAERLEVDLSFQDFEAELADPFGAYVVVLLAEDGCVALRRIDDETCEMKRLYVRPAARGTGLGRRLTETVIADARSRRFRRLRLDSLPSMAAARGLYTSLGFREIEAYRFNPVHGTTFFELEL